MIPLGGYVKMLDEREGPVSAEERERAFNRRPIPHRIAVLLAGPAFNFLFAILAYWLMFSTGVPGWKPVIGAVQPDSVAERAGIGAGDEIAAVGGRSSGTLENATLQILHELLADGRIDLTVRKPNGSTKNVELDVQGREAELTEPAALYTGLGIQLGPVMPAVIDSITPGSPAAAAGLLAGDEVLAVGDSPIENWEQWVTFIRQRPGKTVDVTVRRADGEHSLPMTIGTVEEAGETIGRIGASRPATLPAQARSTVSAPSSATA